MAAQPIGVCPEAGKSGGSVRANVVLDEAGSWQQGRRYGEGWYGPCKCRK